MENVPAFKKPATLLSAQQGNLVNIHELAATLGLHRENERKQDKSIVGSAARGDGYPSLFAPDLSEIRKSGVLRHLVVPCAHFVTGSGDGLDMELVSLFAESLGLAYEYVKTS